LVEDPVVSLKRGGVVVLIEEDLDRDAVGVRPALGPIWATVGAEGALTDRKIRRVSNDCEVHWSHVPLLAPGVISSGVFKPVDESNGKFNASFDAALKFACDLDSVADRHKGPM
jgi:hypothetical protein